MENSSVSRRATDQNLREIVFGYSTLTGDRASTDTPSVGRRISCLVANLGLSAIRQVFTQYSPQGGMCHKGRFYVSRFLTRAKITLRQRIYVVGFTYLYSRDSALGLATYEYLSVGSQRIQPVCRKTGSKLTDSGSTGI